MKKILEFFQINKGYICAFIIGGIAFSFLSVSASIIASSNYVSVVNDDTDINTVQDALNDLYYKLNVGDADASNISLGKSVLVNGIEITGTGEAESEAYQRGLQECDVNSSDVTINYHVHTEDCYHNYRMYLDKWVGESGTVQYIEKCAKCGMLSVHSQNADGYISGPYWSDNEKWDSGDIELGYHRHLECTKNSTYIDSFTVGGKKYYPNN